MATIIKHPHSFIGYQYFISYDGIIHQGRLDTEESAHTVDPNRLGFWNKNSIGICLQGNTEKTLPTEAQLKSLKVLLEYKMKEYGISTDHIKMHCEIVSTACPGRNLIKWVKEYRKF